MSKKNVGSKFFSLIRIVSSILLITFALGTAACSSGGGGESTSATGSAQ